MTRTSTDVDAQSRTPADAYIEHDSSNGCRNSKNDRLESERSLLQSQATASEELQSFCSEVSIVGIYQFVRQPPLRVRSACWMLLILAGTGFTIYQLQNRMKYFFSYPVNVAVSVEYVEEIRFPMTTICNEYRLGRSLTDIYNFDPVIIKMIYAPFPEPSFKPDWSAYDAMEQRIKIDWNVVYGNVGTTPEMTIFNCWFDSRPCNINMDFNRVATDFGNCIVFNAAQVNFSLTGTGSSHGLSLILFVNQNEYLVANSYSAGFRILLQEPNEVPLVSQLAFKIAPGVTTQVSVQTDVTIELPPPYGECNNAANYTETSCLQQCQNDYAFSRCGCAYLDQKLNRPACSWKQTYLCWLPSMQKFITDNVASTCGCHRQCQKKTYNYVATQSEFSELMISYAQKKWNLNLTDEELRRNYAAVEIYFSELKYTYTKSSPAYSGLALLCDIGGALGLVLGGTILTFAELVDLLVNLILIRARKTAFEKRIKRLKVQPVQSEVNAEEIELQEL